MPENHTPSIPLFYYAAQEKPRFSPNKRFFTFLAPDGDNPPTLWIADSPTKQARRLLESPEQPILSYSWAHTNKHILYLSDENGNENTHLHILNIETGEITNSTALAHVRVQAYYTCPQKPTQVALLMNRRDRSLYDVYMYDLETQRLQIVARNDGTIKNWYLDRNLQVRAKVAYDDSGSFYLHTRATTRSKWRLTHTWPADDAFSSGPLFLSPDGRFLYLSDTTQTDTSCLQVLDTHTGARTTIAHDEEFDIFHGANLQELLFKQRPHPCALFDSNGNLGAFSYHKDRLSWCFLDGNTLEPELTSILSDPEYSYWIADQHSSNEMILGRSKDCEAPSYWHYHNKKLTKLFESRPQLAHTNLATAQTIRFKSRDGLTLQGYLTMPPNTTHAPVVIRIHGGPWLRTISTFNPVNQFLTQQGYGCLQINYRGSNGFGKTFLNTARKQWGGTMVNDIADAAQWLCEQGISQPNTIALMGRSYGGFAALCASWRYTKLFSCIIAEVPATNLLAILENCPAYWRPFMSNLHQRLGNPYKDRKLLTQSSPFFNTDRISLPLLLAYGAHDARINNNHVERFINRLNANNAPLVTIPFLNEGHVTQRQENLTAYYHAVAQFLSAHLQPKEHHEDHNQPSPTTAPHPA